MSEQVIGAWRFTADGDRDENFGDGGRGTISGFAGDVAIESAQISRGGRIYVVGWTFGPTGTFIQGLVAAFTRTGQPATGFSGDGWRRVEMANVTIFNGLTILPDGRLIAVGHRTTTVFDAADPQAVMVMLQPDGRLDSGFGHAGKVSLSTDRREDDGHHIAIGQDALANGDTIVLAGSAGGDFLAARFEL